MSCSIRWTSRLLIMLWMRTLWRLGTGLSRSGIRWMRPWRPRGRRRRSGRAWRRRWRSPPRSWADAGPWIQRSWLICSSSLRWRPAAGQRSRLRPPWGASVSGAGRSWPLWGRMGSIPPCARGVRGSSGGWSKGC